MNTPSKAIAALLTTAIIANAPLAHAGNEIASITLEAEMAGQSLQTETVDMVAYYLETGEFLELTITYIERNAPADPSRFQMQLLDGDAVSFALPGIADTKYEFARSGEVITIDAQPVIAPIRSAQAMQ